MKANSPSRICLVPRLDGIGGMVSFQRRLADGLRARRVQVCYDLRHTPYSAVLVIGGTRHLVDLWRVRRNGIPVVQRLDGMNWLHRLPRRRGSSAGLRHFLRAEYGNALLSFIRSRLAMGIIYQSEFARFWWETGRGTASVPCRVIYNGVDLKLYTPEGPQYRPDQRWRVLVVEGSLMGGYEQGLEVAVRLVERLSGQAGLVNRSSLPREVELAVVGHVPPEVRARWSAEGAGDTRSQAVQIRWMGLLPPENIPEMDRSAHLLYSVDINAACPNSVIEALACGLPVLAFDTGAMAEIVTHQSGRVVPYGANPWKLEPPDMDGLVNGALDLLQNQDAFRMGARERAESAFGLDAMTDRYLEVLTGL